MQFVNKGHTHVCVCVCESKPFGKMRKAA